MTPWMRKIHKWIGLLIGLQFVLWLASGLMMSLLDHDTVQGHSHRAHAVEIPNWPQGTLAPAKVVAGAGQPVNRFAAGWLLDRPVYHLGNGNLSWLVDANSAERITIDGPLATRLATADYVGDGQPMKPLLLNSTLEARGHEGQLWRVDFSDDDATTVYLSAQTGQILEHRNRTWRIFDFFWMLHIMDYTGRQNFNNPLVITAAIGGLWLALAGIWLLFASFHVNEFIPRRWRRTRELAVFDPAGTRLRTVQSASGDSVYLAMARNGLQLPSNCGGGQSCGLCEVRFRGHAPEPTSADRSHLSASKLKLGYRLACNLNVKKDTEIEVAGGAALWDRHSAVVEKVTAVTPFLREIVLKTDFHPGKEYQPGAYLQVHVPGYALKKHDLWYPEPHREDWARLELPAAMASKEGVRRSYSLAVPVEQADGRLVLLVRFSPGGVIGKRHHVGKGSTYLYSLKTGDALEFSGPFGDFSLKPDGREKVFIGGGAGMAPLRAMILASLDNGHGERIHYWYGARTLRDTPYEVEMRELAKNHANFSWHLVLSEEQEQTQSSMVGLVHEAVCEHLLKGHAEISACDFYVCGPPAMLSAVRQLLATMGVQEDRIAFDDFKI